MSQQKILYVGQAIADLLMDSVSDNLERYRCGDFQNLAARGNWEISTDLYYDPAPLRELDPSATADAEKRNSILVWRALGALTPALATENRIWIRFTHLDCLSFCRERWLRKDVPDERLTRDIRKHFFADTRNGWRDDNAISRLWWNYWIAQKLMPDDPGKGLDIICRAMDMRLSTVERPGLFIRPKIASGVLRVFSREAWLLGQEARWREFMKVLNIQGAGTVFEVMSDAEIDRVMDGIVVEVRQKLA